MKKISLSGAGKNHIDTQRLQQALEDCHAAGGGSVILEEGEFLSGTLYLRSHVTLQIEPTAVLVASPCIEDYGTDTHHNRYRNEPELDRCFLYAEDAEDIRICGGGKILGSADSFPNEGSIYRPMLLRILRCQRVTVEKLYLHDAAAWTTAFLDSTDIRIRDLDIRNERNYNGDGLDFDGCSHVYVSGCRIIGTDDNLCLQAGNPEYPVEDIHISDCEFTSICAAIRIGLKSIGDIHNVVIHNCTMKNVWREGIKIECTEGGNISDIAVSNITMRNVTRPLFVILNNRFYPDDLGSSIELTELPQIGTMSNLVFSNIIARDEEEMIKTHRRFDNDVMGAPYFNGIRFDANEKHPIQNVMLQNIIYQCAGGVKQSDLPADYPKVEDMRESHTGKCSENYYPDWSRTCFADLRNIEQLYLSGLQLRTLHPDTRPPYLTDGCRILKEEVYILN